MNRCRYPIASLLPHRPPMILLDEVTAYDDDSLIAEATITEDSLLMGANGVPCHAGIEYMAQACGAYAGAHALDSGSEVRIGLLLGTRDYRARMPYFRRGDRLVIKVATVFRDESIAAFGCSITIDGKVAAEAQLQVYLPNDDQFPDNES